MKTGSLEDGQILNITRSVIWCVRLCCVLVGNKLFDISPVRHSLSMFSAGRCFAAGPRAESAGPAFISGKAVTRRAGVGYTVRPGRGNQA
jgi:hypothetical protein